MIKPKNESNTPTKHRRRVRGLRQPKVWALGALALFATGTAAVELQPTSPAGTAAATPVAATRVYDTRIGEAYTTVDGQFEQMGRVRRGTTTAIGIAGRGSVSADASAVDLDIRVFKPSDRGRLEVFACDSSPDRSGVWFGSRWTRTTVRTNVAADGTVCIRASRSTDLVIDVVSQVVDGGEAEQPEATVVTPVERTRLFETRLGKRRYTVDGHYNRFGRIGPNRSAEVYVAGRGALPADADAVMLSVAARGAWRPGVLTIDACGADQHQIRFADRSRTRTTVLVSLDDAGRMCVGSTQWTHLTLDAIGYVIADGGTPTPTTSLPPVVTQPPITLPVDPTPPTDPPTTPAPTNPPTTPAPTDPPTTPAPTNPPTTPAPTNPPTTPAPTNPPTTPAPTNPPTTPAPTNPPTTPAPPTTAPSPGDGSDMKLPGINPSRGRGTASNEVLRSRDGFTGSFNGIGEVRITCGVSHHDYVDPIVLPGRDGASHLHTFFGNAGTDAFSTYESLRNEPAGSTCAGGAVNKSSYWFPSLIDGRSNSVAEPTLAFVYYKTGYWGQDGRDVQPMPAGLRMVSGNASTTTAQESWIAHWSCSTDGGGGVPVNTIRESASIPRCDLGQLLGLTVLFPQCWDGQNLDSADHKSHMSHPNFQGQCPRTHPVLLPQLTMQVTWRMGPSGSAGFYLASDMMTPDNAPPGLGLHADFFDGWTPESQQTLVRECLNKRKDCGVRALGDGFSLIDP